MNISLVASLMLDLVLCGLLAFVGPVQLFKSSTARSNFSNGNGAPLPLTVGVATPRAFANSERVMSLLNNSSFKTKYLNNIPSHQQLRIRFMDRLKKTVFLQPVVQIRLGSFITPSYKLLGRPVGEQSLDFRTKLIELAFTGSLGAPEL